MAVAAHPLEMRLVWNGDELDVDLLLLQGLWTERQYLKLTDYTRNLEFADGIIEVLPMTTDKHQNALEFLYDALRAFIGPMGGKVHTAGIRVRIRRGKYRQPDITLLRDAGDPRRHNRFWLGADLVVEVVSADDPKRDTAVKRLDYAEGGIPEYWIVNPLDETITVLTLAGAAYVEHGVFRRGAMVTSVVLPGFAVPVAAVFDAD